MQNEYSIDSINNEEFNSYFSMLHDDNMSSINNYTLNYPITNFFFEHNTDISENDIRIFCQNHYFNDKVSWEHNIENKIFTMPLSSGTDIIVPFDLISSLINYVANNNKKDKKFEIFFDYILQEKGYLINQNMHNYIVHKLAIFNQSEYLDKYLIWSSQKNDLKTNIEFLNLRLSYAKNKDAFKESYIKIFSSEDVNDTKNASNYKEALDQIFKNYKIKTILDIVERSHFSYVDFLNKNKEIENSYFFNYHGNKFFGFLKAINFNFSKEYLSDYSACSEDVFSNLLKTNINIDSKVFINKFLNNGYKSGYFNIDNLFLFFREKRFNILSQNNQSDFFELLKKTYANYAEKENTKIFFINLEKLLQSYSDSGMKCEDLNMDIVNNLPGRIYIEFISLFFANNLCSPEKLYQIFNNNFISGIVDLVENKLQKSFHGYSELLNLLVVDNDNLTKKDKKIFDMNEESFKTIWKKISTSSSLRIFHNSLLFNVLTTVILVNSEKEYIKNNKEVYINMLDFGYSLFQNKSDRDYKQYPYRIIQIADSLNYQIDKEDSYLYDMIKIILDNPDINSSLGISILHKQKIAYEKFLISHNIESDKTKTRMNRI